MVHRQKNVSVKILRLRCYVLHQRFLYLNECPNEKGGIELP